MRQIILDTETTGLEPDQGHRIVELGCVEIINRRLSGNKLHLYFDPERDSDPEALRVHGLTSEFLAGRPRFAALAQQVLDFVRDAEVIIHNASFDVRFLDAELARAQLPPFAGACAKITDSLLLAREIFPGKRNNLDALCERLGVSNSHRSLHGALLDAELLAEVWLALTRGQDSLLAEPAAASASGGAARAVGALSTALDLPLYQPSAGALQAHAAYLDELEKSSGKPSLWRGAASGDI